MDGRPLVDKEAYELLISTTERSIITGFSDDSIGKILIMDYTALLLNGLLNVKKQRHLESF